MDGSLEFSALKEKQRAIRAGFPETMGLRVHRAISWVGRSEACDGDDDARFLFLWIAFNGRCCARCSVPAFGGSGSR